MGIWEMEIGTFLEFRVVSLVVNKRNYDSKNVEVKGQHPRESSVVYTHVVACCLSPSHKDVKGQGYSTVVRYLPSVCKALDFTPSTVNRKGTEEMKRFRARHGDVYIKFRHSEVGV